VVSLADLFKGRSQLLIYHFMFGPEYRGGCPACSANADGFNGFAVHLEHHDVAMAVVSRAPIAALQAYKRRMGWAFTWASSLNSDFNYDFNTSFTEEQQRSGSIDYNYTTYDMTPILKAGSEGGQDPLDPGGFAAMTGTDVPTYTREGPGMSAFAPPTASSTTHTPPTRAASTRSGECTSGSIGHRMGETNRCRGFGGTTSTHEILDNEY
jgi:predicted dithiol-disulfide oxidoreductase (DUF899 family)